MNKVRRMIRLLGSPSRLPTLVMLLTLAILGATIFWGTKFLRQNISRQIANRDAEILHAVAVMEQFGESAAVADQLEVLLKTSRLKGVIAARLFDPAGRFVTAFPANAADAELDLRDLQSLQRIQPLSRFYSQGRPADLFWTADETSETARQTAPLLEVTIPLHWQDQTRLLGIAQFILDGKSIADEFAALDLNLIISASLVFLAGSLIVVTTLSWAFGKLQHANRLLSERSESLLRANHELSLAAKTSAVGAVTAHLIHGLTNPLSGLQLFVTSRGRTTMAKNDDEWREVVALTERMQKMIEDVVIVLREEQTDYEISLTELRDLLTSKLGPIAQKSDVRFVADVKADGVLTNRSANLVSMILTNLISNAIQACPAGKCVTLTVAPVQDGIVCDVRDEGSGVPPESRKNLFMP